MFHFSDVTVLMLVPGIAGLMLLVAAGLVALVFGRTREGTHRPEVTREGADRGAASARELRVRYAVVAFVFWSALTVFLVLDLAIAASVRLPFTASYAALGVLVGALLLHRVPLRPKLMILALFLVALFSVPFIAWNSRKPFLRDLYRVREGMTRAQVDEIMGQYMGGDYGGPPSSSSDCVYDEQGHLLAGSITYRHTNEGWGNSDWGVVTFENGRVVETRFYPD
jgi:hypothetical protein